jgi:heme iron utilization protein
LRFGQGPCGQVRVPRQGCAAKTPQPHLPRRRWGATLQAMDPYLPVDATAWTVAATILQSARIAALGVIDPTTGGPMVSRVAVALIGGVPALLLSSLSAHTGALRADPRCSLLIDGLADKGDPLNQPRLTLTGQAIPGDKAPCRAAWLARHPKAAVYIDFADFSLWSVQVWAGFLNAGFGRAYRLEPGDLRLT